MSASQNDLKKSLTRALAGGPRSDFIAELLALHVHLLASIINAEYFEAFARRRAVSIRGLNWSALFTSIIPQQRLAVMCRGNLCALLVQKLIRFRSECTANRALKHSTAVFSRMHFVGLKDRTATCSSTLKKHIGSVSSVAFHPSAPYLVTGSMDGTAKLWQLNSDGSVSTCVSTLKVHKYNVISVAFSPDGKYIATGSDDNTNKLWLLNADYSAATCVSTLRGHSNSVTSVAFHPSAPYLATGSDDGTAKLWLLNADCSAVTCVSTLRRHRNCVNSVAFHPSAPYLATGSFDGTAKLWR